MAQTETALLTVEEFEKIPDPPGGHYVLHHGELVFVPPPILRHALVGRQLWRILDRICAGWYVDKEFALRPSPEYEVWEADLLSRGLQGILGAGPQPEDNRGQYSRRPFEDVRG